jgi:DNA-directed RNA polymerase subunit beta
LGTVNYLLNLIYFQEGDFDDVDDLQNRYVRPTGKLIQGHFQLGVKQFEDRMLRLIEKKDYRKLGPAAIRNWMIFFNPLRKFFGTSQLSQYLDQTNPLAEITHKRRLSSYGPGGLRKDQTSLAVREIHPSHYGRICPIETPEGLNAGVVNSITTHARLNTYGFLTTPVYRVIGGEVQKQLGARFLSARVEKGFRVGPGDLCVIENKRRYEIQNVEIASRYSHEFQTSLRNRLQFIGISHLQMISIATSLIPFLEHDDANRALMASNMQRQALPLIELENPIVGTGLEGKVARDSRRVISAKQSGQVQYVSGESIIIKGLGPSVGSRPHHGA